ncbi:MAG: hypothetical protein WC817_04620 [Patescibacteria group bacterium]|jgi:hypothetical protein
MGDTERLLGKEGTFASEKIMSTSAVELCSLTHKIIFERPHAEGKEY